MKSSALPAEFQQLAGQVNYVRQVAREEFSSSCPKCGGTPHRNGEWPDRFRMFLNARGKNKVLGWCRHCGFVWFPSRGTPFTREEMEAWRKEQIAREEERKRAAEEALKRLRSESLWTQYHNAMTAWAYSVVASWGIRKEWADHWRLGFLADYTVFSKQNGTYHSPAISIPLWQYGQKTPANIKLRVLNPRGQSDRYRAVYKVGGDHTFVSFNWLKTDTCVLVEGEKKAMVVAQGSKQRYQVIGVPSKTPSLTVLKSLDSYGHIVVCLDPDASEESNGTSPLKRMVQELGPDRTSVLMLNDKVDDMINRGMDFNAAMRHTKRLEVR